LQILSHRLNLLKQGLEGHQPESSFLTKLVKKNLLHISVVVVVAEYLAKASQKEAAVFKKLMARFGVLPVNEEAAFLAAEYRKQSLEKTKRILIVDCFFGCTGKTAGYYISYQQYVSFPHKRHKNNFPEINY